MDLSLPMLQMARMMLSLGQLALQYIYVRNNWNCRLFLYSVVLVPPVTVFTTQVG
jgi:hypothetical protein